MKYPIPPEESTVSIGNNRGFELGKLGQSIRDPSGHVDPV
jgi:hypothetical protein